MATFLERYRWLIVATFCLIALATIAYLLNERRSGPDPVIIKAADAPLGDIRVYVTGAVLHPGVYPLHEEDRWIDAVAAAGGAAPDADLEAVNLSRRVHDEDQVTVPRLGQVAAGASQGPLININTAGSSQLQELPGIGEVRAEKIIQSRTQDGAFASVDDLVTRKLIPQSVLDTITPLVTIGQ